MFSKNTLGTWLLIALAAAALFFIQEKAEALMVKTGLETLAKNSDLIITGKVMAIHSYWNKDKTFIWTDVKVEIGEAFKGAPEDGEMIITQPGGQVADRGLKISDTPVFTPGEEVLLFLKKTTEGKTAEESLSLSEKPYSVLGGAQGKMKVLKDKATGEKKVVTSPLAVWDGKEIAAQKEEDIPLKEFAARLKKISEGTGK